MVGLSLQLADLRRRRAGVQLRIEYTRMQIPFGWVKRVDPATKAEYYELLSTGQRRRQVRRQAGRLLLFVRGVVG